MGLFVPEDKFYDESVRQTGFNRYKQLLSLHFLDWFKVGLLTTAGALPLIAGITYSILVSSVLLLIPLSLLGGMFFGPFLAGLYDAIARGLRDDPMPWWENYKKSWKQNCRGSLLPGALVGLFLGVYAFMFMLLWWAQTAIPVSVLSLFLISGLLFITINTLYWPLLVLFEQSNADRLRNMLLFSAKYLWKVLGVGLLQLGYWSLFVLLAPWTLLLIPVLGAWYIVFLSLHLIYVPLNEELQIEERLQSAANA